VLLCLSDKSITFCWCVYYSMS